MVYSDSHTHTYLSNHGRGTVEEVVAQAAARKMTAVALTEHLPLPPEIDTNNEYAMDSDKPEAYIEAILAAREKHPEIEVILGIEIDWRTGATDYILENLAAASRPYELRLGSVHMLTEEDGETWEFDHMMHIDGWYKRGAEKVWTRYLELWFEAVESAVPFDIMAHPDLPKKLGFKPTFDTRDYYAAMADVAAKHEVMVEVNTSGLYKTVAEIYPAPELLTAFCAAGVACTMGSDAHRPNDVGRDFDKGCALMRAAGYTEVTIPTRSGDRRPVPLDSFEASWRAGNAG